MREGRLVGVAGLRQAIREGARGAHPAEGNDRDRDGARVSAGAVVHRDRADIMKRIAAPMIGGIFTSFILELVVYPAVYEVWRSNFGRSRELRQKAWAEAASAR